MKKRKLPYSKGREDRVKKRKIKVTENDLMKISFPEEYQEENYDLPENYEIDATEVDKETITEANRLLKLYRKSPLHFVKNELGYPVYNWKNDNPPSHWKRMPYRKLPLWSKQREILEALVTHRKVAVKSCHAAGKTFIAAIAALYLAYVWKGVGITTAPTFRQVKRLLWAEIGKIYSNADQWRRSKGKPRLGGKILQTALELGSKWFIEGFSTDNPDKNIPGYHDENVFVIVDEAGSVDPKVYEMLETVLTSENHFVLLIGNPIDPASPFKDFFKPDSDYYQVTIKDTDTPNVKNKKNIYKELLSFDWPKRILAKYKSKKHPFYMSRVKAEFPESTLTGLISYLDIVKATERELPEGEVIAFSGDIARQGQDNTCIGKRWSSGKFRIIATTEKKRTTDAIGRLKLLHGQCSNTPVINIDDIGVGGGVTDSLIDDGYPVNGIVVSEEATRYPDESGRIKYFNKRTQYYCELAKAFEEGEVDIDPEDEELIQELAAIPVEYKKDYIKIPDKDSIKKDIGRSPDRADAMMLAWAESEWDEDREIARFL